MASCVLLKVNKKQKIILTKILQKNGEMNSSVSVGSHDLVIASGAATNNSDGGTVCSISISSGETLDSYGGSEYGNGYVKYRGVIAKNVKNGSCRYDIFSRGYINVIAIDFK